MWIFLSFGSVSVFSFLAVAVWVGTRHQERKDFYRSEMLKKLAESGSTAVIEYLREEERLEDARRVIQRQRVNEGNRLAGSIVAVVGLTLIVALRFLVPGEAVFLLGLIPIGVGVVLILAPWLGRRRS
jgi:hypothetical protein